MNWWRRLNQWFSPPVRLQPCQWATSADGGWGYGTWWYCTAHRAWYPEQVFMEPPSLPCQSALLATEGE